MNTEQKQILLRKKGKKESTGLADSSDSLLDLLCNVVGVLVLVSSLAGVFAATSAVNIQAPMKKETKKQFWTLQAAEEGVWDLQPAINRMAELDRERAKEVRLCENLLSPELEICNRNLDGWNKQEQINESTCDQTSTACAPEAYCVTPLVEPFVAWPAQGATNAAPSSSCSSLRLRREMTP